MYTDYMVVDIYYIKGILKRGLIVQGNIIQDDFELKLFYDDIEQRIYLSYEKDNGTFNIEHPVNNRTKKIKLLLKLIRESNA